MIGRIGNSVLRSLRTEFPDLELDLEPYTPPHVPAGVPRRHRFLRGLYRLTLDGVPISGGIDLEYAAELMTFDLEDGEIADIVERLRASLLTALAGPAGSGSEPGEAPE
jgi:hypothetical protein